MPRWTYGDWQEYDGADRLARLRKHITEARNFIQGTTTRGNTVTAVTPDYIASLEKQERELAGQKNGSRSFAFNKTRVVGN